jgi:hypothetical protein
VTIVPTPILRLLRALGIDRTVAYSLLTQGWMLLVTPITLFLTVKYLTKVEQGYFYAFGGIIVIQSYFELGFGLVTLQFISHEAGHLTWTAENMLAGDPAAKSRLASLVRLSAYWYLTVAALMVGVLLPAGWVFFLRTGEPGVAWQLPWVWTVLVAAAGVLLIPADRVLSGSGKLLQMVRFTSVQRIATSCTQWLALAAGGGLLCWPAGQSVGVLIVGGWLWVYWRPFFRDLLRPLADGLPRVDWWREVWPFQWRIAVGAPFGYLSSQLFNLVLFADTAYGSVVAGEMGMSLAVMNVLMSTTISWVGVRVPAFGQLVARRDWLGLDRLFRRVFIQSTLVAFIVAFAAWVVLAALQSAGYKLGTRVLPPLPLGLLLANAVVQHMVHALAAYLRAHKREPFFWLYISFGMAMGVAVFTVGRAFGPVGMAASLLTLNTAICLGTGTIVFIRCRRAWHADPAIPVRIPD